MSDCSACGHPDYFHSEEEPDTCDYDTDSGRCTCSGYRLTSVLNGG